MGEDYPQVMTEIIQPHLLRFASDHSPPVRIAFVSFCESTLSSHIHLPGEAELSTNVQLIVMLLLLMADEVQEVQSEASRALSTAASSSIECPDHSLPHQGEDIEDGEIALRNALQARSVPDTSDTLASEEIEPSKRYLKRNLKMISRAFVLGISSWTTGSQILYLRGLRKLTGEVGLDISEVLEQLLLPLGSCLLDDDAAIRSAAELLCQTLGEHLDCSSTELLVLPYISGSLAGFDNSRARAVGVRLTQHLLIGHLSNPRVYASADELRSLLKNIGHLLVAFELHEFRDFLLMEAILLLVRQMIEVIKGDEGALDELTIADLEFSIVTCLVLLMGCVQGDAEGPLILVVVL